MTLAEEFGLKPDEGMIVAWLPPIDQSTERLCSYGTAFEVDGEVIDLWPSGHWWKVRAAAHELGLESVFPKERSIVKASHLDEVPLTCDQRGRKLYTRRYSGGPWICLTKENDATS